MFLDYLSYKEWRAKNKVDAVVVGSEESKSEAPRPSGTSHVKRGRGGRSSPFNNAPGV